MPTPALCVRFASWLLNLEFSFFFPSHTSINNPLVSVAVTVVTCWPFNNQRCCCVCWLVLNELCAEWQKDGLECLFSPDIIPSGWLGSKHQLSAMFACCCRGCSSPYSPFFMIIFFVHREQKPEFPTRDRPGTKLAAGNAFSGNINLNDKWPWRIIFITELEVIFHMLKHGNRQATGFGLKTIYCQQNSNRNKRDSFRGQVFWPTPLPP